MIINQKTNDSVAALLRWRESCLLFATEELGMSPDPYQIDLFNAFSSKDPKKMRIALKACKGVGKTAGLAVCIWNFMAAYGEKGEHPKGAATSITEGNIDDNLWPELAKWQARSQYLTHHFKWTKSRIFSVRHPETWFFSKRTWAKGADINQQANTLAGLHSKYLLFVGDESGDIPEAVFAAADAGLTGTEPGRFQKVLQAGNPTRREGPLYRAAHIDTDLWYTITITGDPDNPNRAKRQNIDWSRDQIKRYGRDSPWVLVNVFGEFPETSINALFSDKIIMQSWDKNYLPGAYHRAEKRLGIDVARMGDDMTIIAPRQGLRCFNYVEMSGARNFEIADRVITSRLKWGAVEPLSPQLEFVDGTGGFGGGVVDDMIRRGYTPHEIHFSQRASDPLKFENKRAEMYFEFADWVKRGGQLPRCERLKEELCATTYSLRKGRIILAPKEIIKTNLGRSPDRGDAYALTFAQKEGPGHLSEEGKIAANVTGKALTQWNPFAR